MLSWYFSFTRILNIKNFITLFYIWHSKKNKAINKLAETDIIKAPREFYSAMKKLGGLGKGANHVTKMAAHSEPEVANLKATYIENTFQPLSKPYFNCAYFDQPQAEWDSTQTALDQSSPPLLHSNPLQDHSYLGSFTPPQSSPILGDTAFSGITETEDVPNTTKH